jgi:hypothetical protein
LFRATAAQLAAAAIASQQQAVSQSPRRRRWCADFTWPGLLPLQVVRRVNAYPKIILSNDKGDRTSVRIDNWRVSGSAVDACPAAAAAAAAVQIACKLQQACDYVCLSMCTV